MGCWGWVPPWGRVGSAAGVRGEELWARRVWVSRRKYFWDGHSVGGQAVPMVVSMGVTPAPQPPALVTWSRRGSGSSPRAVR